MATSLISDAANTAAGDAASPGIAASDPHTADGAAAGGAAGESNGGEAGKGNGGDPGLPGLHTGAPAASAELPRGDLASHRKNSPPPTAPAVLPFKVGSGINAASDRVVVSEAVRKLVRQDKYIELWHFTEYACKQAATTRTAGSNVFSISDDGSLTRNDSWPKAERAEENLDGDTWFRAYNRYMEVMQAEGVHPAVVEMFT